MASVPHARAQDSYCSACLKVVNGYEVKAENGTCNFLRKLARVVDTL